MNKAEELALKLIVPKQVDDIEELCRFFYIKGYNQAEKDFALTWRDLKEIVEISNSLEKEWQWDGTRDWGFYQEVLKRYLETKKYGKC